MRLRPFRARGHGCEMKIDVNRIRRLFEKHGGEFRCRYQADVVAGGKKFKAGSEITHRDIDLLAQSGVRRIEVKYDVTLYEYLSHEFPAEFRRPLHWLDYYALDQYLEELEQVNARSGRKRHLALVGDVYRSDGKSGGTEIVFRHGDRLDYQKWKSSKIFIASGQKFFVRSSENGVILFGDIRSEDYADDDGFRKRIDLVQAMEARRGDKKYEISPDFIPRLDVRAVALPGKLAEEYISSGARLVVLGEKITSAHKEAILQVKAYDPFVRMMVTPPISPQNIDHVLLQMKMMYTTDRWKKR